MKKDQGEDRFLKKTQEVLYQREFRRADKVYNQMTQKRSRS